jgi:hypothetical protein
MQILEHPKIVLNIHIGFIHGSYRTFYFIYFPVFKKSADSTINRLSNHY